MGYAEVKEIYNRERLDYFVMAISHLMDIGFRNAQKITDEQIKEVEGNGFMTKEFCEWLLTTAREIANACHPSELIQLCQANDVFAPVEGLSNERMKELLCYFIELDIRPLKSLIDDEIIEPEDLEALGYWTEEDVENYYYEEEE